FDGIGACIELMRSLCERYWGELHPAPESGDLEHRAYIIRWVDEKLLPAVRQVPITALGRGREYHWADWEQAKRNERMRGAQGARPEEPAEGAAVQELMAAMAGTPTERHLATHQKLGAALQA